MKIVRNHNHGCGDMTEFICEATTTIQNEDKWFLSLSHYWRTKWRNSKRYKYKGHM